MKSQIDQMLDMYENGVVSRRNLVRGLAAIALGVPLAASASSRPGPTSRLGQTRQAPIQVLSLNHVTCFVSDIPRTVEFYQDLFGMPVLSDQGTGINLRAGSETQFVGIYGGNGAEPVMHHLCLGVEDFDVDRIGEVLDDRGVEWNVRMRDGTVPELYMTDPDGLSIQLQDVTYCGGSGPLGNGCT